MHKPILFAGLILSGVLASSALADEPLSENLICCGAERVFIVDGNDPTTELWSWNASESPSIPVSFRAKFRTTDDCKPYAGGLILITSSSSGVALIQRETKQCLFLAEVPNAHSACLLPGNQIAVAASTSRDEIQFFSRTDERKPAVPTHRIPLLGAHGTFWNVANKELWVLGTIELLQIKPSINVDAATPWTVVSRFDLPSKGGHDLSPVHDDVHLVVTTNTQVLKFNMTDGKFRVAEEFASQKKIKSVDVHPVSKRIVYHQALPEEWWSHTIRYIGSPPVTLDGQRLYKIRWDTR